MLLLYADSLGTVSFANPHNYGDTESRDLELPLYDMDSVIAATDNFSFANKLGEGGFGPVFKVNNADSNDDSTVLLTRVEKLSNEMSIFFFFFFLLSGCG